MLAGGVYAVLTRISATGAFFALGADNFVRTCVVRNGIGRHGSYMIGDYTSLIVTMLIPAGFPVVLTALAETLERPVSGCWRCTADIEKDEEAVIEKDEEECCLACGSRGKAICYHAGARRAKQFMTRRVHAAKFAGGPRALNIDSEVLPHTPENLTHTATMAAQSIARSTFALLQIESAYMDRYAARMANKIHDPNLVEHIDLRLHGSSFGGMSHTHVLGLLAVCSNNISGLLVLMLMLRLHPIIGRLLDTQVVPLLCDVKLYKALLRLFFNPNIDLPLLLSFWPAGFVLLLGFGLHPYKKYIERVCVCYSGILAPLFEDLAESGGKGNAGKWFDQAKMGKFITFLSALLCAAHENWETYVGFCTSFPTDPVVLALRMLIEVHLPLVFLTIATVRLLGSPDVQDRERAMRILHDELMPQLSVNFKVLGSPEYSKITLEYYTHLTFFQKFRPDLYAAMQVNGTRLVDEVNIELVHAFVATHFVMVQMAHSDYKQSVEAFTARGPMLVLQKALSELAALKPGGGSRNPAAKQLLQDTAAVGAHFKTMLRRFTQAAGERDENSRNNARFDGEVVREQILYCRWAGAISRSMLPCPDVDMALDDAANGLIRDLHSTTNAELVNDTITEFKRKFYDSNTSSWIYREAADLRNYWEGGFLPSGLGGLTRKISRGASTETLSAAASWQAPKSGQVLNFEGFGGFAEIVRGWLDMLPSPSKKRTQLDRKPEHQQSASADEDIRSHDSGSTRGPSVSGEVDEDSGDYPEDTPQLYDTMADVTYCKVKFCDRRGMQRDKQLTVNVGVDEVETLANIEKRILDFLAQEMTGKRNLQGEQPLSNVQPKLVSIECGIDFHVATAVGPRPDYASREAVAALHVHVKEHMSAQFGTALDLLSKRRYAQAHNLACLIERARPSGAADLNVDFTNTAMSRCIIAVARAAQGVELMNRAPDVLANRERAHEFLRDALDDIDECLQDSKFITSSSLRGPGITLRFNLTHIMQTLIDMQQAIVGYSAQNPTDELR